MAEASSVTILHGILPANPFAGINFSFPSVVAIVPQVVDAVVSRISSAHVMNGSEEDIELSLHEALLNAVIHGNRQDPFKRVHVTLRCGADGGVQITIRDEGAGFDVAQVCP